MAVYQVGIAFYEQDKFRNGQVRKRKLAVFKCECSTTFISRVDSIPPSCGCKKKEHQSSAAKRRGVNWSTHEMSKTKVYKVWAAMLRRCRRANDASYPNYGGRGIRVCDEWMSFEAFYRDMGEPNGLTIERIDVNGMYEKSNCRWATMAQQSRNRRSNVNVTVDGVTRVASDWAKEPGAVGRKTIVRRIRAGIEGRKAVFND